MRPRARASSIKVVSGTRLPLERGRLRPRSEFGPAERDDIRNAPLAAESPESFFPPTGTELLSGAYPRGIRAASTVRSAAPSRPKQFSACSAAAMRQQDSVPPTGRKSRPSFPPPMECRPWRRRPRQERSDHQIWTEAASIHLVDTFGASAMCLGRSGGRRQHVRNKVAPSESPGAIPALIEVARCEARLERGRLEAKMQPHGCIKERPISQLCLEGGGPEPGDLEQGGSEQGRPRTR